MLFVERYHDRKAVVVWKGKHCKSHCLHAVAYAENFHGGGFGSSFVFSVCCLWRHNLTSFPCFRANILAKFVDIICIFFYIHSLYFMCHCTEYKLSALQVRLSEKNKLNATTQQFITAKNFRLRVKKGEWNTHHYVRAIYNFVLSNSSSWT